MAKRNRRVNSRTERARIRRPYEDGSAVRQIDYDDERRQPERNLNRRKKKSVKKSGRKKQSETAYILFLVLVLSITMFSCVNYLQLKSKLTSNSADIAELESQISELRAENDAYYNEAMASVSLEEIKEAALQKLGLHYADSSQIRYYDMDDEGYVRQYTEVP